MTDDATLSDFASADTDDDGATEASREAGDTAAEGASAPPEESPSDGADSSPETGDEPTRPGDTDERDDGSEETADDTGFSTYAWGRYTCSQCESASRRVWRADGELVCADCKAW